MAQNIFERVKNSDLTAMSSAELNELLIDVAKGGMPKKMTKAEYMAVLSKITAAIDAAKAKENGQPQAAADEPKVTEEDKKRFAENVEALNGMKYEADADHRKKLNHLLIETGNGKGARLQDEIIEAAKLRVLTDNVEAEKPLDKEAYKTAVDKEIDTIIGAMFKASANNNKEVAEQDEKWNTLVEQQHSISSKVASGELSAHLGGSKEKAEVLATKYDNKNFLAGFTAKLNKVVDSCTKKMGKFFKQTWETVKVMYKQGSLREAMIGGGLAVGSILAAGTVVGAPIAAGLAAYSGWMAYNRTKPVVNAWYKEKEINGKDYKFKDFYKAHKRDVWKAGLYTVAGVAGVTAGVVGAVAPFVNTASDTAVILSGIRGTATATRLAAIPAATTTPYVIDYFNAETKADKKKALRNIAIVGGTSVLALGAAAFGADMISEANASEVVPTEAPVTETPVASDHDVKPFYDWESGELHTPGEATPVDGGDVDASGAEGADGNADGTDGYVHQFETRVPTDAEQAFYEARKTLVPNPDAMIANVEGGIVHLTGNMTAEQAIHLAAMDKLYYGDDTALKLLLDCDTVKDINSEEFFNNLHSKFVTDINDPRGMGFPTDPNYHADPNIHARITHVDCDDIKIQRVVSGGKVVEVPMENVPVHPIDPTPVVDDTPVIENGHIENAIEIVEEGETPTGKHPDFTLQGGHIDSELDARNQLGGNDAPAQPIEKPKGVTLTDAQMARILMGGNTK